MLPDIHDYDVEDRPTESFSIKDDDAAEWALRKIRVATERITAAEKQYERELFRLQAWLAEATKAERERVQFFESHLFDYHARILAEDPARKTVKLPHGNLVSRARSDQWDFADEFIEWAQTHAPGTLRTPEPVVDKAKAKAYLQETGEAAPGVTVTEQGPSFSVKVSN